MNNKSQARTQTQTHEPTLVIRSSSSCAACKLLKRRCSPTCIFAPYFRADEPKKFAQVHKVFGASNISKILSEVPEEHREDAVNSLTFEAEARLRDPVYGCLGPIAILHRRMVELQHDLAQARTRLARYTAYYTSPTSSACVSTSTSTSTFHPYCGSAASVSSVGGLDHCYWYCGSNDNYGLSCGTIVSDDHLNQNQHISMSLGQFEGAQLGPIGGYNNTNMSSAPNFGQVPLLPL